MISKVFFLFWKLYFQLISPMPSASMKKGVSASDVTSGGSRIFQTGVPTFIWLIFSSNCMKIILDGVDQPMVSRIIIPAVLKLTLLSIGSVYFDLLSHCRGERKKIFGYSE